MAQTEKWLAAEFKWKIVCSKVHQRQHLILWHLI